MKTIFAAFLLSMFAICVESQTLVNTSWTATTGLPATLDWSASCTDASSKLYVAGNTQTTGGEDVNLLVTKFSSTGSVEWEVSWDGSDSLDYGTAITATSSYVYVCGATMNAGGEMDYVVLKLNGNNGSVVWTYTYDYGGHDGATDIGRDGQGNIIVTGASDGGTTLADYATIKINDSNGSAAWTARYNYSSGGINYMDAAAKLVINSTGSTTVTGGSGVSADSWDFCSVRYSSSGTQSTVTRTNNPDFEFNLPTDVLGDVDGNVYVCGRVATASDGYDMKLLKMDVDLNLDWEVTFDGYGEDDQANALDVDDDGNIYLTGYYTNANNKKEMVVMRVDSLGDEVWTQTKKSLNGHCNGNDIILTSGRLVVSGSYALEASVDALTMCFDLAGNLGWQKNYDDTGSEDGGRQLQDLGDSRIYLTGVTQLGNDKSYFLLKYEWWERNKVLIESGDTLSFFDDELIIKIKPEHMITSVINNRNKVFGKLNQFVSADLVELLDDAFETETKDYIVCKVYKQLRV